MAEAEKEKKEEQKPEDKKVPKKLNQFTFLLALFL